MELEAELKGFEEEGEEMVKASDVERKDGNENCVGSVACAQDITSSVLRGSTGSPCEKKARTEMSGVDVNTKGKEKALIEFTEFQMNSSCNQGGISLQKSTSTSLEEIVSSRREEVESNETNKCDDDDDELMILDPVTARKTFGHKRKRDSLLRMLCWINGVAKNPCHPEVGSLPDISKWNSFSNEFWRQILMAREATFSKRHIDPAAYQLSLQRNQRMHPAMYDDHGSGYKEKLRCRKSLLSKKKASGVGASFKSSPSNWSDLNKRAGRKNYLDQQSTGSSELSTAELIFEDHARQQVPLGPRFQAVEPEWTGLVSRSEFKWLGTKIWPPEKIEHKHLTERDPIGKGRQNSCGCQLPGSTKCVRFHIAQKRLKLKEELGSAFYKWKFNKMGEEVGLSWTKDEEKKFKTIVELNPPSLQKSFWVEIFKSFPTKSREELVSYYFNVFMVKRREYQNRVTPSCINSDDEDESAWDLD